MLLDCRLDSAGCKSGFCAQSREEVPHVPGTECTAMLEANQPIGLCLVSQDSNLRHTLQFGIGMHHAGLGERDRKLVERLFVEQKIQVLTNWHHTRSSRHSFSCQKRKSAAHLAHVAEVRLTVRVKGSRAAACPTQV